jgi:hypothetical protein
LALRANLFLCQSLAAELGDAEICMKFLFLAFALALCGGPAAAEKPASIVGRWGFPGNACASAMVIGPMSLRNEDVYCRFESVKRIGNQVTWKGPCDDAEGSSQETVIATEKKGSLTIRYMNGGNVIRNLRRCEP